MTPCDMIKLNHRFLVVLKTLSGTFNHVQGESPKYYQFRDRVYTLEVRRQCAAAKFSFIKTSINFDNAKIVKEMFMKNIKIPCSFERTITFYLTFNKLFNLITN